MTTTTKRNPPVTWLNTIACLTILLLGASQAAHATEKKMNVHVNNNPYNSDSGYSDHYQKNGNNNKCWIVKPSPTSGNSCQDYEYNVFEVSDSGTETLKSTSHGKQCRINKPGNGNKKYKVRISCLNGGGDSQGESELDLDLKCKKEKDGRAIFDFTAHTDTHSIATNMSFTNAAEDSNEGGCNYQDGQTMTGNCLEGALAEVLVNENNNLQLYTDAGEDNSASSSENLGNSNDSRLTYFNKDKPWFDVERLRVAADWLTANKLKTVSLQDEFNSNKTDDNPITGTMTMREFLRNVANNVTMYGVVRVLVGFERDDNGKIHRCSATNDDGLCDCAPAELNEEHYTDPDTGTGELNEGQYHAKIDQMICHRFENIERETEDHNGDMEPDNFCGIPINPDVNNPKIKVKGTLFFDYVYETKDPNGDPVYHPLSLDASRDAVDEIGVGIGMPILVNWDDGNTEGGTAVVNSSGTLDSALANAIKAVSAGGVHTSAIDFNNVPQSTLNAYNDYMKAKNPDFTEITDSAGFGDLPESTQYHMLMPTGYEQGWADAFTQLGIKASEWEHIMSAMHTSLPEFKAPTPDNPDDTTWTAKMFRSDTFEDIPAFVYAGGFLNINTNKIFISGLTYIPEAFVLDVTGDDSSPGVTETSYFSGAVMVRDGFYIQAEKDGLLLMSSDPNSYSKIMINGGKQPDLSVSESPGVYANTNLSGDMQTAGYGGLGVQKQVSPPLWVEIRPQ